MELVCQICGKKEAISQWQPEFEEVKEGKQPPYICHACQDKIRADANRELRD